MGLFGMSKKKKKEYEEQQALIAKEEAEEWLKEFNEKEFHQWMDRVLENGVPEEVKTVRFDFSDSGYVYLAGGYEYEGEDQDWMYAVDFENYDITYCWGERMMMTDEIESRMLQAIRSYLQNGKYAGLLKSFMVVSAGYIGSAPEILYQKQK